jgi:hypothetical protein
MCQYTSLASLRLTDDFPRQLSRLQSQSANFVAGATQAFVYRTAAAPRASFVHAYACIATEPDRPWRSIRVPNTAALLRQSRLVHLVQRLLINETILFVICSTKNILLPVHSHQPRRVIYCARIFKAPHFILYFFYELQNPFCRGLIQTRR